MADSGIVKTRGGAAIATNLRSRGIIVAVMRKICGNYSRPTSRTC